MSEKSQFDRRPAAPTENPIGKPSEKPSEKPTETRPTVETQVDAVRPRPFTSGQIRNPTTTAGRHLQRLVVLGSMIAVIAFVAIAASGRLGDRQTPKPTKAVFGPVDVALSTQLDLELNALTISATGQTPKTIKPSRGPQLAVVVRGSGRVDAPGDKTEGRRFLFGGNQSTNTAFLTSRGTRLGSLFSPIGGQLSIETTSLVDLNQRTSPMGRNDAIYLQFVGDDQPRTDSERLATHLLGVVLVIDPVIGPYLSVTLNGGGHSYLISAKQRLAFSSGRNVVLGLRWARGEAKLLINNKVVDTFAYPTAPKVVTRRARLSIGASADFGAGLFAAHDDSLRHIFLSSAVGP
jgi:hypothetical protein